MIERIPKEYISKIAKASTYFSFKNGPIKEMLKDNKISEEDLKEIQRYMDDHLAYLYTVLLEENNLKKFDLIVNTMNKFYVDDKQEVLLEDDGFNKFFDNLFPQTSNITINQK
jgi:hypothetical protein